MREIDCLPSTRKATLNFDRIEFNDIPGQSRLFLDYQTDPLKLTKYYPSAVAVHTDISKRLDDVLQRYSTDRGLLCDALFDQNQRFGAGERTFENIGLLRNDDTVAVVTGQQAGLFTGPLYTVYKALSAVRMVECLRDCGVGAVPVFWAATEDHDFDEITTAFLLGRNGDEIAIRLDDPEASAGRAVGDVTIPESFRQELECAFKDVPQTSFTRTVCDELLETWRPGRRIADAFCTDLQRLFADRGIIVVDPLEERMKRLAAPIYSQAIDNADEIVTALLDRSGELESDGYHAQVLISPDYFPLFFHDDHGVRRSIRRRDGSFTVTGTGTTFTAGKLSDIAGREPGRLSPGVMLRPVVQDFLFPTICYFGGGAEIAYFAQNSEVYRVLDRPVTTIFHRQSFTVVDPKQSRVLDKYELSLSDLFDGFDSILPRIVDSFVNPATARVFSDVEEKIDRELDRLDRSLSQIDPTLAVNLATRRRKIAYHIAALQKKFRRVQIERDEIVNRQLRSLFASLLPDGQLQERRLNVHSFLMRYGPSFIGAVYDSIDLDERGHRVLYLS